MKKESAQVLWSQIFNGSVESVHKTDRGGTVARYISTNRLLRSCMENGESRLTFAGR